MHLHELMGWPGPMTARQFASWRMWLQEEFRSREAAASGKEYNRFADLDQPKMSMAERRAKQAGGSYKKVVKGG